MGASLTASLMLTEADLTNVLCDLGVTETA